ncbi:MAG: hypothetical protein RLZZ303_3673 [Candidatus Hydrogenedentota bacterium]|jgi:YegS/Rv2252/BmrU family lipid kinase
MHLCVIANPVAGAGLGRDRAARLRRALEKQGHQVELLHTRHAGDAEQMANERARAGFDGFIAIGGDGTANEMVNGLGSEPAPFTVLPVGTANVVAREFRIPGNPEQLARQIAQYRPIPMDLGDIGGRRFLLGAGAGLDAAIAAKVKARRGRTSSLWIWVRPSIEMILRYDYPPIRVTVDGRVISESAHYAIVGNCVYSAGLFPSTPRARTDDGLLDVCLIHDITAFKCAALALQVWSPRFIERPDVTYCQGVNITLEPAAGKAAPLQVDGDPAGEIPARFTVLPAAARILAP